VPGFRQELVALFGQPVEENPTQAMVEAAFAAAGLDWRYLTVEVAPAALGDAVCGARAMGFRGFNCTIPHKVAVVEHLDCLSQAARLIGAVNTVVRDGDELAGENTDGAGFLAALRSRRDPRGLRVVLLGAGGAARAIGVELALAGAASITVVNRARERGGALGALLRDHLPEAGFEPLGERYAVPPCCLLSCSRPAPLPSASFGPWGDAGSPSSGSIRTRARWVAPRAICRRRSGRPRRIGTSRRSSISCMASRLASGGRW
jgi:shikimate dehydrogenase